MRKILFATLATFMMQGCNNENKCVIAMDNSHIECGNIKFTQSLNLQGEAVKATGDTLYMTAGERTDLFCDPKGISTNTSASVLLSSVDNTKPFTFTVKVQPQFTEAGTHSLWGKA